MIFNPDNVPCQLIRLLPMAQKWGIGDDLEREEAVANASEQELESLVHSIDNVSDEDLYGWLAGPLADSDDPTPEYLAITCLTMAIDSAKLKLQKLK